MEQKVLYSIPLQPCYTNGSQDLHIGFISYNFMSSTLTSSEEFSALLGAEKLVLVDFFADWCEPCKWLDDILDDVEEGCSVPLSVLKIDVETYPELALENEIKSVPVLLLFKDNILVWRINGFLSSSDLVAKIETISRGTPEN